jgi:hypothetical protein
VVDVVGSHVQLAARHSGLGRGRGGRGQHEQARERNQ